MKFSSHYLHVIGGRLRIKIPQVKNSLKVAQKIEQFLSNLPGVTSVKANPFTGNVLVLFDSDSIRHQDIVEAIRSHGYFEDAKRIESSSKVVAFPKPAGDQRVTRVAPAKPRFSNMANNILADILLQKLLEVALRRALVAFL